MMQRWFSIFVINRETMRGHLSMRTQVRSSRSSFVTLILERLARREKDRKTKNSNSGFHSRLVRMKTRLETRTTLAVLGRGASRVVLRARRLHSASKVREWQLVLPRRVIDSRRNSLVPRATEWSARCRDERDQMRGALSADLSVTVETGDGALTSNVPVDVLGRPSDLPRSRSVRLPWSVPAFLRSRLSVSRCKDSRCAIGSIIVILAETVFATVIDRRRRHRRRSPSSVPTTVTPMVNIVACLKIYLNINGN